MKLSAVFSTLVLPALFLISAFFTTAQANSTCDYIHPSDTWKLSGDDHNFQPGDTICLEAGERGPLRIENIHGTAENPIIIINHGGQVVTDEYSYGINLAASSHVRLTGSGDPEHFYGIRSGGTVFVGSLSTDIEVDHIETYAAGFAGFMIKTDPNCDPSTWRENFVMTNISVHDNYAHSMEDGEGFYIGFTFSDGYTVTCNGQETTVYGHLIENLKVYNNRTDDTGAEGIQVSSAPDAMVYNNHISRSGQRPFANYQDNGMQIGYSGVHVFNNLIENGPGTALMMFGTGHKVYNNLIVHPGRMGIFADDRKVGSGHAYMNNTVIEPGEDGIVLYMDEATTPNLLQNNIIVNPGNDSYWRLLNSNVNVTESHNILAATVAEVQFNDPNNSDYSLTVNSPAVDQGIDLSAEGVATDSQGVLRPQGDGFDIGAYEFVPTLRLSGSALSQTIELTWVIDSSLANTTTWKIEYQSGAEIAPTTIRNLPESTRSYSLTGLTNYEAYTVTLSAMAQNTAIYSDTMTMMPTDRQIYLPTISD